MWGILILHSILEIQSAAIAYCKWCCSAFYPLLRRTMMVRWGIAKEVIDDYLEVEKTRRSHLTNAAFTEGKNEYWPIPQEYIESVEEGLVTQNDGY